MAINGINGSPTISNPTAISSQAARTPSSIPPAPPGNAASTHISGPGELFGRLQQLSQQDPAKFKEVAQSIADKLHQAAKDSSGKEAERDNKLADRFAAAAQSGDMSAFQPAAGARAGAHAHHHHHHGGDGGGASNAMGAVLASALDDVNQALASSAPTASAPTATPSE